MELKLLLAYVLDVEEVSAARRADLERDTRELPALLAEVNAALDRLKARGRQQRWISHSTDEENGRPVEQMPAGEASHERRLLAKERWEQVTVAVAALPDRQRLVFTLCHLDERTPAEISAATGMSQATVRVHLFRALRKLRGVLGGQA